MTFIVRMSHWKLKIFLIENGVRGIYLDVYFIDIGEEILNSIFIFYIMKHHKALPLKQLRVKLDRYTSYGMANGKAKSKYSVQQPGASGFCDRASEFCA